jgi:exonuclease SbcC
LTEAQAIEEKKRAKESADTTIATLRQAMPDVAQVTAVLAWFQQRNNLETQFDHATTQGKAIEAERSELLAEQLTLAKTQLGEGHDGKMLAAALQTALDGIREEIQVARLEKEQIKHREGLAAFAVDLVAGNPCPLCGAVHHPAPYHAGKAAEKIKSSELILNALEAKLKPLEGALAAANVLAVRLDEKAKQLANQQTEAKRLQQLHSEHSKSFAWPQYDSNDATKPESDRLEAAKIQKSIVETESQRSAFDKELETLFGNQERYRAGLEKLREERSQFIGLRDSHLQQRTILVTDADLQLSLEEIARLSQQLSGELKAIDLAYQSTQETERNLDLKRVELEQRQVSTGSELARLEKEMAENQGRLSEKLSASGFASVTEVESILGWNLDLAVEQKAVSEFKMQLQSAESTLAMLVAQAGNEEYDPKSHAEAESAIVASKGQIETQTEGFSLLREELKRIREELAQRKALEAQQEAQRRRLENLKVLERLFVGSGFVKYVSTKYLQELVARADIRFRQLTRNALSLELGTENEFLVRDMLNGGQTRSVKTLSGGQTFQASLCLALALADNVQQHSGSSHNFFFLDEGFGTLDKESLASVFDALKQLRQENRIVGVISHVEEMQQEIEVFLKVTQTEEKGSMVKGSWE